MYNGAIGVCFRFTSEPHLFCSDLQRREHAIFPGIFFVRFSSSSSEHTILLYTAIDTENRPTKKKILKMYLHKFINLFFVNNNSYDFTNRKYACINLTT